MTIKDIEGALKLHRVDQMTDVANPQSYSEMKRVYERLLKKRAKSSGIIDAWLSLGSYRSAMREQKTLEKLKKVKIV